MQESASVARGGGTSPLPSYRFASPTTQEGTLPVTDEADGTEREDCDGIISKTYRGAPLATGVIGNWRGTTDDH